MRTSRSGTGKTWQERVAQAQQRGFDRLQAIAGAAGLLRELERYVARREHQGRHTEFDEMLEACLPGLALAIALLRGQNEAVESDDVQERWGEISPELADVLRPLAAFRKEVDHELARCANERDDLYRGERGRALAHCPWGTQKSRLRMRKSFVASTLTRSALPSAASKPGGSKRAGVKITSAKSSLLNF